MSRSARRRRSPPIRPSGAAAAACRRSRRACPRRAPRRCGRRIGCPRSGRNWQGSPAARSAASAPRRPARGPVPESRGSPRRRLPRPCPSEESCDPFVVSRFSRRLVGGQSAQLFGALRGGCGGMRRSPWLRASHSAWLMPSARRELATAGAAGEADGGRRRGGQMDPADLGATELTALFAKGSLSPLEALDAALARIGRLNPVLNAIVTLDPEGARAAARASTERWAKRTPLSPLDGVPVTIKDNLLVRGLRATWGSRLYADFVPDTDELPVARLRGAGAVILGKTNVPELTLQGYTDNPLFGPTRNPWDPALTPGGSSGGAVASVASGMAALALATDGGGSIRRPASHAGLFGLKPTVGRVARADGFPAILHDFEVAGPIARTVGDIDVAMAVLAGADPRDPASVGWPAWRHAFAGPTTPLRILHMPAFEDAPVDREIALSVGEAVRAIEALGHRVEPGTLPFGLADLTRIFTVVSQAGAAWVLRRTGQKAEQLTPAIRGLAENGAAGSAADYVEALALADRLKRALAAVFERYDVIVTPAAAALPWPAARSHPEEIDGKPVGPRGHAVFTAFANISGCPGLAVPCALSRSGLPIGMQMVGRRGDDELLLWLAGRYVGLRPDCIRRPLLAAAA